MREHRCQYSVFKQLCIFNEKVVTISFISIDFHITFGILVKGLTCIVMLEASDALSKTADSDTVSTYQVSSVQLVTDKKLQAFNKA